MLLDKLRHLPLLHDLQFFFALLERIAWPHDNDKNVFGSVQNISVVQPAWSIRRPFDLIKRRDRKFCWGCFLCDVALVNQIVFGFGGVGDRRCERQHYQASGSGMKIVVHANVSPVDPLALGKPAGDSSCVLFGSIQGADI